MDNIKKKRVVDLEIVSFSKKGNGIGTFVQQNGASAQVEVPFMLPGDKVRANLFRKRGGTFTGKLEELLTPSPQRIAPRCVHFGVCGGCRLQHISYENQLQYKENFVRQCFASILTEQMDFRPIVPCAESWHYRNKMEYSFSCDAAGKKYLGLVVDSSKGKVFNMSECHLTNTWFVDALKSVKHWWNESGLDAYYPYHDRGSLRTLMLREGQRTGDRMAVLTVSGNPEYALSKKHLESFVAFLRDAVEPVNPKHHFSIFLRIQQVGKGMTTNLYEMLLYGPDHIRETLQIKVNPDEAPVPLTFHISPSAFFQTNTKQAEQLYSLALGMAKIPRDAVVYDLYCGTGVIGICVSKHVKEVIGIELSPESALDARTNASRNKCTNVKIISGAIRHVLTQIPEQNIPRPDVVIVDPPRPGLDPDSIKHILEINPPKILYISCNPVTQATNVAEFLKHGYRISAIQPIDQFPQTYHVENIVVLER